MLDVGLDVVATSRQQISQNFQHIVEGLETLLSALFHAFYLQKECWHSPEHWDHSAEQFCKSQPKDVQNKRMQAFHPMCSNEMINS